jgi:alpha-L-fucosidase
LTFPSPTHSDFRTPEYEVPRGIPERKWELARGVGHSFGANRHESPDDIITERELIQMFCDVVSKGGNLLIGIGPRPDGTIPEIQQVPLRGLGSWLAANGEAIYGSRPWAQPESSTVDGTPVRFTRGDQGVYALVLGMPSTRRMTLCGIDGAEVRRVRVIGTDELVEWSAADGRLTVTLPERMPLSAVTAVDLGPEVRPQSS